ncbi:hypothetical protein MNBD_GAMMA03-878 [hydrothermal vent metagenome]|uniref:Nitrogen regulatory protein P-II n=1 Tax=hydrothermal vent metagenome TaxID=652676 RepID=A0A3B0WFI2_9ZZZZ
MSVVTHDEKIVQIITSSSLEPRLLETFEKIGITGYTAFNVRGNGDSGIQDSHIDADTNILLMIVTNPESYERLMEALNKYKRRGQHLMVFSMNTEVLS